MKNKAKVLVVEDEVPLAMMMVHILTRAGCEVVTARTGRKGMELAQETQFDLITLDVDLPDINGFTICEEVKQRHVSRNTPIVFISGRPLEENAHRSLEVGAADYITKPFEATDFIYRIISAIKTQEQLLSAY